MVIIAIYFVRVIMRDVLVPIFNYSGINTDEWEILMGAVNYEVIFYGVTDFITSMNILYLFYLYSKKDKKTVNKSEKTDYNLMNDISIIDCNEFPIENS